MNFSGVKKISLEQGKRILKVCTNTDLPDTERISQCIKIYSGAGDREIVNANANHLRAVYLQILRLILPENILPLKQSFIHTQVKLYELDLDAAAEDNPCEGIPEDIEDHLARYCIRYRNEGHGFKWEEVTDYDIVSRDLKTAAWRDVIQCYWYLKERTKEPAE